MSELEYQKFYNENYYLQMVPGIPYDRFANDGHWLRFFNIVASKLTNYTSPKSILDVGCAKGFLLEAFYNRGITVSGFDYSEYAISCVREDLKPFVFVSSATSTGSFQKHSKRYDLITCIEVVEHMPRDEAVSAIKNMCLFTDSIFFSSTSDDFTEPTHLTVLPRIEWLKIFSEYGFIPDYNFVMPEIQHGVLLRKTNEEKKEINALIELHEIDLDNRKKTQSELAHTQSELAHTQSELAHTQSELAKSRNTILWMESSKFWKLRLLFIQLKKN